MLSIAAEVVTGSNFRTPCCDKLFSGCWYHCACLGNQTGCTCDGMRKKAESQLVEHRLLAFAYDSPQKLTPFSLLLSELLFVVVCCQQKLRTLARVMLLQLLCLTTHQTRRDFFLKASHKASKHNYFSNEIFAWYTIFSMKDLPSLSLEGQSLLPTKQFSLSKWYMEKGLGIMVSQEVLRAVRRKG